MTRRVVILSAFIVVFSIGAASAAFAHSEATGIVKERMDQMKSMRDAVKVMAAMFAGRSEFDAGEVERLARGIADKSGNHITRLFPKGSLDKPSEALPDIWADWPKFETLSKALARDANALAKHASQGKAMANPAFFAMTDTCGACHKAFKAD